jgi:hypothetical protein
MRLRISLVLLAACFMPACSGQTASGKPDGGNPEKDAGQPGHDGGLPPPASHRPTHVACMTTRPPGIQDAGGYPEYDSGHCCHDDLQCPATNDAGGTNGRCMPYQSDGLPSSGCPSCNYDQCSTDTECGTDGICECGSGADVGRTPNECLTGNCEIDSDCGSGRYCAPSAQLCTDQTSGYYCTTPGDQCHNDSDCPGRDDYQCLYDTTKDIWDCQQLVCPG